MGLCNYVRQWIFDYSALIAPLLEAMKKVETSHKKLVWTPEMEVAFQKVKDENACTSTRDPNYGKEFFLLSCYNGKTMTTILTQK